MVDYYSKTFLSINENILGVYENGKVLAYDLASYQIIFEHSFKTSQEKINTNFILKLGTSEVK